MIKNDDILRIANYFSIISHVPGRLRVRVSSKIKNENSENKITLEDIENLPKKINGINSIKINKLMGSITIKYEPKVFLPTIWEDLINGNNLKNIKDILTKLEKEVF